MNKKELATIAIKYWQSVEAGDELDVITQFPSSVNWVKLQVPPSLSNICCSYQLVAPCHTELLLKHLNEGVEVEVVGDFKAIGNPSGVSLKGMRRQSQERIWTDPNREIREVLPYKDGEVWWCYMGSRMDTYFPLIHRGGQWFRSGDENGYPLKTHQLNGFNPLYKIGDLK